MQSHSLDRRNDWLEWLAAAEQHGGQSPDSAQPCLAHGSTAQVEFHPNSAGLVNITGRLEVTACSEHHAHSTRPATTSAAAPAQRPVIDLGWAIGSVWIQAGK